MSQEDIVITRNGTAIAKLSAIKPNAPSVVKEEAESHGYGIRKVSYEEFLELTRNSEERYEYIDGEIYLQQKHHL